MSGNPFAPLQPGNNAAQGNQQAGRGGRTGRARSGGIVGGSLRKAGLIDEDSGMRDASASGPRRAGRGAESGRGGGNSLSVRLGEGSTSRQDQHRARDRANPMAARSGPRASHDPAVTGQAFGIRGAASRGHGNGPVPVADLIRNNNAHPSKGKGRVPGGGGGAAHASQPTHASQQTTGRTIAVLKKFLQSRWVADAQFLNLEAMATDAVLIEEGLKPPGTAGAHKDLGSVMWKLSREMFPNVSTISLAKNDLKTLLPVATLPDFLANLKNLSLENNDIKWVRDLTFHSSKNRSAQSKFASLQELILNGNPVHDNAIAAGNQEGYRAEVLARFADLKMLDRVPVSPKESSFAALPGSSKGKDSVGAARGAAGAGVDIREFPLAIRNKGFADQEANSIIPAFLSKYFENFDSSRDTLRAVYSTNATFTVVTSSSVPPRARSAGYVHKLPRQKDLSWRAYKDVSSHNIMTLGVRPASKGFPRGPGAILATISKLPKTKHPLTDASKFVVDAWVIDNATVGSNLGTSKPDALLFISVQGEYAELPSLGVRSFSRCFVVAPVPPGSTAANLGWPCVIISDQLTVRQYAGADAWDESQNAAHPSSAAPAAPASTANGTSAASFDMAALPAHLKGITPAAGLSQEQHIFSLQLAAQTNLTYPFAVQCLVENGWNPTQALSNFQALKAAGSIPAEAFVSM